MEYSLRRKARKIQDAEALEILRRCDWGVLSLAGLDGTPYGVPLNYVLQEQDGRLGLIFHCAREGRKIDYLKTRPQGAFVVVQDPRLLPEKFSTAYASVMVSGRVAMIDAPEEKRALLRLLVQGLSPDFAERGDRHIEHKLDDCLVLRLEVEAMCGKSRRFEEPYALENLGF